MADDPQVDALIEMVAKAAEEAADYETHGRPYMEYERICNWPEIATAAIHTLLRAMETPSEAMLTAGVQNNPTEWNEDTRDGDSGFPAEVANDVWRAMLREFARGNGVEMEESDD